MNFRDSVIDYIRLQRALLGALEERVDVCNAEYFNDVPEGRLRIDGRSWRYAGHGRGITFEQVEDGTVVNVHVVPFLRDAVDAWRLELYIESRMPKSPSLAARGQSAPGQTARLLEELVREGYLRPQAVDAGEPATIVYRPTERLQLD